MIELTKDKKHIIIKRDGREEPFNEEKLRKVIDWATEGKEAFTNQLLEGLNIKINDKMKIEVLYDELINTAVNKISPLYPMYDTIAEKLYLMKIYKETCGLKKIGSYPHIKNFLKKGIKYKIYDKDIIQLFTDKELDKINPGIGMLAESDKPDELLKAFDASYGFAWFEALEDVFVNGKSATLISERWSQMESGFPKGTHFIRWIDNHDRDRAVIVFSEKGSMAASTLNFMLDGIPFIYNGQEIGDATPYGSKYYPEKSYRDNGAIIWGAQGLPHQQELRDWYKKLIAIRKNEPVLRSGKTLWLATDHPQDIIAFLRCNDKEEILTIINVSNRMIDKISVKVSDRNKYVYDSILSSEKVDDLIVRNNKLTLSLGSFGYHVCKVRK